MQFEMKERHFADLDLNDPFFDSLKSDYGEFSEWFERKTAERAYVMENDAGHIEAFLYVKEEDEPLEDIEPKAPRKKRLKVGTFKVNPHGTRLGERLLKKAFDHAVKCGSEELYVTVFPKHTAIISGFERYGFKQMGTKTTSNGLELVLSRPLRQRTGEVLRDFPSIPIRDNRKFVLGIYPEYHTRLFPDSILNTESIEDLDDVSHTNSIHKVYVCWMDLRPLKVRDALVIYRTSDKQGPAWYRSVATSICVVEEVRGHASFANEDEYVRYCLPYSVFGEGELRQWWRGHPRLQVIRMTYNAAMIKRVNRRILVEDVGLDDQARWGFLPLTDEQFERILELGRVDARLAIN